VRAGIFEIVRETQTTASFAGGGIGTEWTFRSTHPGALRKVLNAQLRASQSMVVCARMASAVRLAT
jgi:hypothetical protein